MLASLADLWAQQTAASVGLKYLLTVTSGVAVLYIGGLVFLVIERIRPAEPQTPFFKRDFKTELCYPLFNAAFTSPIFAFLVIVLTLGVLEPYAPHHIVGTQVGTWPYWLQILFALLIADTATYIEHRFAHRFMWDFHAMHHMAKEVSWLTYARVHPINGITIGLVAIVMSFIFGFDSEAVITATWIGLGLAAWEHSNLDFKLPKPFSYLIVTPHFHRWHHANEKEAVDKNFCLIFPFLDLLMGTYYCPDRKPSAFGLYSECEDGTGELAPEIPDSFSGQLVYPFKKVLERSTGLLKGRSPARDDQPSPAVTP